MSLLAELNRAWMGGFVDDVLIHQDANGSFQLEGALSYANVSSVYKKTAGFFKKNRTHIQIDLGGITHSDSAGVALLVEWLSEARDNNQILKFINIPKQMLEMVRISSLERVLPITE